MTTTDTASRPAADETAATAIAEDVRPYLIDRLAGEDLTPVGRPHSGDAGLISMQIATTLPEGTALPLTVAIPRDDAPDGGAPIMVPNPKDATDELWLAEEAAFLMLAGDPDFATVAREWYRAFDRANRMLLTNPELADAEAAEDVADEAMFSYPTRDVGGVAYKMRRFMGSVEGFENLTDWQKRAARRIYADLERLSGYAEHAAAYNRRIGTTAAEPAPKLSDLIHAFYEAERAASDARDKLDELREGDRPDEVAIARLEQELRAIEKERLRRLRAVIETPPTTAAEFAMLTVVALDFESSFSVIHEPPARLEGAGGGHAEHLTLAVLRHAPRFAGVADLNALTLRSDLTLPATGAEADEDAEPAAAPSGPERASAARAAPVETPDPVRELFAKWRAAEQAFSDAVLKRDRAEGAKKPKRTVARLEKQERQLDAAADEVFGVLMSTTATTLSGVADQIEAVVQRTDLDDPCAEMLARITSQLRHWHSGAGDEAILAAERELTEDFLDRLPVIEAKLNETGEQGPAWDAFHDAMDRMNDLAAEIRRTPARTIAGAAAKLRLFGAETFGIVDNTPDEKHYALLGDAIAAIERGIGRPARAMPTGIAKKLQELGYAEPALEAAE